jgi:hypothetical protein
VPNNSNYLYALIVGTEAAFWVWSVVFFRRAPR